MKIITQVQLFNAPLKVLFSCVTLFHPGINTAGFKNQIQLLIKSFLPHTHTMTPVSMLPVHQLAHEKFH